MKEFPPFRLDTVNQCLWRRRDAGDDERILLPPKAFAVLRYLVERAGPLVSQDELLDAVWPGVHVQPQVVKSQILDIRSALEDRAKNSLFIETLHRRGYRFVAAIRENSSAVPASTLKPALSRIVGRDGELEECLRQASEGQRKIMFVTGEPGIGKTALVDEFQRRAVAKVKDLRVARGQCSEGCGGKEAYYPMLEALGQLCSGIRENSTVQTLAAQAPTWLVQFPALLTREHRATLQREIMGATRERMLREIGDVLETITSVYPLLLVFDDLQWVDHSTVDLISALARRRAPARLMLVGTYRPVELALAENPLRELKQDLLVHQLCREIVLGPLGEAEIAEYLAAESSISSLPAGLARLVHRCSEGNPLFMMAALNHMRERDLIARANGSWRLRVALDQIDPEVPENLRQMIEVEIERLTSEEQRALELASVGGVSFLANVCTAAADLDPQKFEDLCEKLTRRNQVVRRMPPEQLPDGSVSQRYQFVHSLYRAVCYGRQAPGRRMRLHQRIGERLEALFFRIPTEVAAELAYHFERASDWSRAVKYLRLAAETAGRRYAPREATALLRRALELSSKLPEAERAASETGILQTLATTYVVSFDMRAIETYEALIERAARYGLIEVEVKALIDIAYPLSWASTQRCLEVVERALQVNGLQKDPLERASTRANCLVRRVWAGGWNDQDAEDCQSARRDSQGR